MGQKTVKNEMAAQMQEDMKKAVMRLLILRLLIQRSHYLKELTEIIKEKGAATIPLTNAYTYRIVTSLCKTGFAKAAENVTAPDGRMRRYYAATKEGRHQYYQLLDVYQNVHTGILQILDLSKSEKEDADSMQARSVTER